MKKFNIYHIAKMFFIIFCALFLLTSCSDKEGGQAADFSGGDEEDLQDMQRTCWQSSMLKIFYENLGSATSKVYETLTQENLLNIIMVAFSVWMAYQIMQHVATPSPESPGEFWNKIIRKGTLCLVCGILASSQSQIYYTINTFVMPAFTTMLQFAANILKIMGEDPDASSTGIQVGEVCEPYAYSINDSGCQISSTVEFKEGKFPDEPLNLMSCMACAISDRLSVGYTIATKLITKPFISAVLVGLYLYVCFTFAKIGFAFYLVDSIFRLNIMMIILPFLILFYPFEQTRKWTITGFKIIIHAAAMMMCLAILVSMSVLAMQKLLSANQLMQMDFSNPKEYYNFGVVPLAMIFMGFMIIKTSATAAELAGSVTGSESRTAFQQKVAALMGTVAKGIFAIVTWGSGKVVTTIADHVERIRQIIEAIEKAKKKAEKIKNKMNSLAGR